MKVEVIFVDNGVIVKISGGDIVGIYLFVVVGCKVNIDKLNLEVVGVDYDKCGVKVDDGLCSVSNCKVYVIGDVVGGM